jgi:DNA (cytosine-5)-methyltransferase 1
MTGPIPVVDLFAGPGGLGEGFVAHRRADGSPAFRVRLSIEMDAHAHETLELRSFFHAFEQNGVPDAYYEHLQGERSRASLFEAFPEAAGIARSRAWHAELGKTPTDEVHSRIEAVIADQKRWVLCGGPPCQAYSIVGRSRNGGINLKDHRLYLYREYLKILAVHQPPVFIMENVKGLLSSTVEGSAIFTQMVEDLQAPGASVGKKGGATYRICPLVSVTPTGNGATPREFSPNDYVIPCEKYGIPQSRHRVILLGIREDIASDATPTLAPAQREIPVSWVLHGLPPLRSGLSREPDSKEAWQETVASFLNSDVLAHLPNGSQLAMVDAVCKAIEGMRNFRADRGAEFVPWQVGIQYRPDWFVDERLMGACNHASRPHMASDLHRYLFVACYAKVMKRSPELGDFPKPLLPKHKNVLIEDKAKYFDDRFRVQLAHRPAMTVTCHIAKDGHYYIHPDPSQCRSFTVREAARVQTFPDNYYFCGTRTAQYRQVGNAVPPLLAEQIARVVLKVLTPAR